MENRKTVFDVISQVFTIFGFSVICLMIFSYMFGEDAKRYSSIFELENNGLALSTLAQFLLTSTIIVILRQLFFTDVVLKNISITVRTIGMFGLVVVMIVLFVWIFGWFPVNEVKPWIMFLICFTVSAGASTIISVLKEKENNKKIQEALERLKEGKE